MIADPRAKNSARKIEQGMDAACLVPLSALDAALRGQADECRAGAVLYPSDDGEPRVLPQPLTARGVADAIRST